MGLLKIEEPSSKQENQQKDELPIIGIDLGTTNSLAGIVINDEVRFFRDKNNSELHKSIVAFDEKGEFQAACNEAEKSDFKYKISSIKRLMGKSFDEAKSKNIDFEIEKFDENKFKLKIGQKSYLPEEISAFILKYLKNLALENIGEKDKIDEEIKAVITVPAYFDEGAKNATKYAAKLAGIEVIRLVNEPTAAALAYGLDKAKQGIYAVYDFGGGTFDISILKMQKGVFKVLGVSGNNQLGGDDIDEILAQFIAKKSEIKNENLKEIAKKAKEEFSEKNEVKFEKTIIKKEEFEKAISEKIDETINLTKNLIQDLELEIGEENNKIQGIILVGGSSRILLIQEKLREVFGKNIKIFTDLNPDAVVGQGAVLQAYNLSGKGNSLILDVLPLSLGVEMMGGIVDKVIYRNTTIPIAMAKEFTTYADNQTGIKFKIVQGEREFAKDCRALAEFEVKNIPPLRAGLARVLVTFKVDADGLLTISSEEKMTGAKQEIAVNPSFGLNENQVKEMLIDSLQNSKTDIKKRLFAEAVREAKQNIDFMKRDLQEYSNLVEKDEENKIREALKNLENVVKNENSDKEKVSLAQKDLEKVSENFALQKMNKSLEIYVNKGIDEV